MAESKPIWIQITETGKSIVIERVRLPIKKIGPVELPIGNWDGDPKLQREESFGTFTALTPPDG